MLPCQAGLLQFRSLLDINFARPERSVSVQAKKNGFSGVQMEKHEAVVSGIMSSIGFDSLELSDQTMKVGSATQLMLTSCWSS